MESQFSVEKVKGEAHRTSKKLKKCRMSGVRVYLRAADQTMPTAN